jgi:hypothetical protein
MINACFLIASRNKNADVGIISIQVVLHDNNSHISYFFLLGVPNPLSPYGAGWRSALDRNMSCGSCGWLTLTKQIVRKDPTT